MYHIVRHYAEAYPNKRVIKRALTLAEAQAHCSDPETSSRTCKLPHNVRRTRRMGAWFDGYTETR